VGERRQVRVLAGRRDPPLTASPADNDLRDDEDSSVGGLVREG
jgi:hypothetical protein